MIVLHKRRFRTGAALAVAFFIVLAVAFSPVFGGINAFEASDNLFNSIAKGSSDYLHDLRDGIAAEHLAGIDVLSFRAIDEPAAERARALVARAGARAGGTACEVTLTGSLGAVMAAALEDAEALFHNRGQEVAARNGYPEREVLATWWMLLKGVQGALEDQERFADAEAIGQVITKGIEVAYNFYGIEPWRASDHALVLAGALGFYIVYTLWWGFAIMFLFDGIGLEMKAGAKREV